MNSTVGMTIESLPTGTTFILKQPTHNAITSSAANPGILEVGDQTWNEAAPASASLEVGVSKFYVTVNSPQRRDRWLHSIGQSVSDKTSGLRPVLICSPWVTQSAAPSAFQITGHANAEVKRIFQECSSSWKAETMYISSLSQKYLNEHYARIIGLGRPALNLIFEELNSELDDWFYALRAITGQNPVPEETAGDKNAMREAWLTWAVEQGLFAR